MEWILAVVCFILGVGWSAERRLLKERIKGLERLLCIDQKRRGV